MSETPVREIRVILGDQLNAQHSWYRQIDQEVLYVMMELRSETDYVRHHAQKLLAFFASMRRFAEQRQNEGHQFRYFRLTDRDNRQSFSENLRSLLNEHTKVETIAYLEPEEYRLDSMFREELSSLGKKLVCGSAEHFLTSRMEVKDLFKGNKTFLMERFYRHMRQKWGVLMDSGDPAGGQWNYDASNRKKLPKNIEVPSPLLFKHDLNSLWQEVQASGAAHFGQPKADEFPWPLDREEALQLLDHFLKNLLPLFGTYQDAMSPGEWSLFHSRLSFALNVKMLHPLEVVRAVEEHWRANDERIDISQAEGFIRQVLGWREYVRGIYWAHMPDYANKNFFAHSTPLPDWFWTGETKMNCLKDAIDQSLEHAYAHHIQRLMLTGNFALLLGVHPDEIDAWYLGIYIDAIEWVEMPNTRGMSQFADGGIMATKPYVSSANYIKKMSDYCTGCHYDPMQKTGERACPFNSLYWDFFDRHRDKLEKNPRIGMAYRNLNKMDAEKKAEILGHAKWLRENAGQL